MQQEVFDGEKLSRLMEKLPKGKPRIDAYEEAIRLADQTKDTYWRLGFRFHYASEVYFQDDPPKCIGAAAEFGPIFEAAPLKIQKDPVMIDAYLMITQLGVDVMQNLPQIPMAEYEALLEQYDQLTKRYGIGRRTYYWQMMGRWEYADPEQALEYIELAMQTPPDDHFGNCNACEHSWAAKQYIRLGRLEEAQRYIQPLETYRFSPCENSFQNIWAASLEYALDRGDLETAVPLAQKLYKKGNRNRTDLRFLGPVLRCWGMANADRGLALFARRLEWSIGMWDQKKVYDFDKGACILFRRLAGVRQTVKLELPQAFPLWREDGRYPVQELADWFLTQAETIGRRFDRRNRSHYFEDDLAAALKQCGLPDSETERRNQYDRGTDHFGPDAKGTS